MLQYFETLTDDSGNSLLGATVTVTNYPSGSTASIYNTNGTASPIPTATVAADITGQVSFYLPDGAYTMVYTYKGTVYKTKTPVQILDPMGFVAATDTGTANNYIVSGAQYPASKYVGLKLEMLALNSNTGSSTLTFNGDGGNPIKQPGGNALAANMINANGLTRMEWDGTEWQLVGIQSQPFYPAIGFEAGVTIVSNSYLPGNLRRYGAKIDGVTDDTTAINSAITVALNGLGFIYHDGGVCVHASGILFASSGTGLTVLGNHYNASIFKYTGSASVDAWRVSNNTATPSAPNANSSGFGLVAFEKIQIQTAVAASTRSGLRIDACGFAYYNLTRVVVSGTFKYGVILNGAEVVNVEDCILENSGPVNAANLWLVNGADLISGQAVGYTNSIFVRGCEMNISGTGSNNIADDGGSNHYFRDNNLNGAAVPIRITGVGAFEITGNEMENALGGSATGEANIDFLILTLSGSSVGPCFGGVVSGNYFGADMAAGGSSLRFGGAGADHYGIKVHGNEFRENSGVSADIYVTNLGNSDVGPNYHNAQNSSVTPYTGTHNDANGNHLWPPHNGYLGTWSGNHVWGDNRYLNQFIGGVSADSPAGLCIDEQQHQNFTIVISNASGTLQVAIVESGVSGGAAAYANKIANETTVAANLPTVGSATGFGTVCAGMYLGSLSVLVLNVTNAQTAGKGNSFAFIEQYSGNVTAYTVYVGNASRNVNGTTILRPEIRLINALTGAAVTFATALAANGNVLNIKFVGYLN